MCPTLLPKGTGNSGEQRIKDEEIFTAETQRRRGRQRQKNKEESAEEAESAEKSLFEFSASLRLRGEFKGFTIDPSPCLVNF
jgi:hypothetical protein